MVLRALPLCGRLEGLSDEFVSGFTARSCLWSSTWVHVVSHPWVRAQVPRGLFSNLPAPPQMSDLTAVFLLVQGALLHTTKFASGVSGECNWGKTMKTHQNKDSVQGNSQGQRFTLGKTCRGNLLYPGPYNLMWQILEMNWVLKWFWHELAITVCLSPF